MGFLGFFLGGGFFGGSVNYEWTSWRILKLECQSSLSKGLLIGNWARDSGSLTLLILYTTFSLYL